MTEASVVSTDEFAYLVVRNTCTAPADSITLPRSVPRFVKTIAEIVGLFDADEAVESEPWTISSSEEITDLRNLVTNPARFLPVILVTEPYALDAPDLARRMYGAAHIVTMPDRFSHEWLAAVGKPYNAFLGAVRTYNPSLELGTSDPFDHPLALRDRIRSFATDGLSGEAAFTKLLVERANQITANRIALDPRALRYSQVRAEALEARRLDAVANDSDDEIRAIATEELIAFRRQAEEAQQMQDAALEDNALLDSDNKALESQLFRMQAEVLRMRTLLERDAVADVPELPDFNDDESLAKFEQYLAGRVILTARARRELKDSQYHRPEQIADGLLLLANEFWRMKTHQLERGFFDLRCAQLGLEYAGSIDERNANGSYFVPYRGRNEFMDMALKAGNSREPRYCMRSYTFWDAERRLSVVGSLPAHLENTLS